MSIEILISVIPSPSHYNMPSTRKLARKSIVPILSRSHQFVSVLSRPIISKGNGIDKTVYGPDCKLTPPLKVISFCILYVN